MRRPSAERQVADARYHVLLAEPALGTSKQIVIGGSNVTVLFRASVLRPISGPKRLNAAKAATLTVPIVFTSVGDPVGAGLVASLGRPGGNVTGLSGLTEVGGKPLQLLRELSPGKEVIAVLVNPETPFARLALKEIKTAAEANRIRLVILEARTAEQVPRELQAAVTAAAGGLLVLGDPLTYSLRREIADLSAKFRLPAVYPSREWVEAGGLMSYGADRRQMYRRAAEYVDKILKGAQARRPARRAADEV